MGWSLGHFSTHLPGRDSGLGKGRVKSTCRRAVGQPAAGQAGLRLSECGGKGKGVTSWKTEEAVASLDRHGPQQVKEATHWES